MPFTDPSLIFAAISAVLGALAVQLTLYTYWRQRRGERIRRRLRNDTDPNPAERIRTIAQSVAEAGEQFSTALAELEALTHEREGAVERLQIRLAELSEEEAQTRERVESLQQVPVPALEAFEELLETAEKKSSRRELRFFVAGVVTTVVIDAVIRFVAG